MEDSQEKMRSMKNLQINGFAMILQVWFYEHNSIYAFADEKRVPRLSSWVNLYKGTKYDAGVVVRELKDSEIISVIEVRDDERRRQAVEAFIVSDEYNAYVEDAEGVISVEERLRRARDALRKEKEAYMKEKEAHLTTKKELDELKEAVALNAAMANILEFAMVQRFSTTADDMGRQGVVSKEATPSPLSPKW